MKLSLDLRSVSKKFSYGQRIRPARDWYYLLLACVVLVAFSVGWNLWLLARVERGEMFGTDVQSENFDTAPIESVREVFELRKAEELKYKREYRFVDPRLSGS